MVEAALSLRKTANAYRKWGGDENLDKAYGCYIDALFYLRLERAKRTFTK